MLPRRATGSLTVGNDNDISAGAPSGFISTALGSFSSVVNVTSESSPVGAGNPVANAYTLQLNTNYFNNKICSGTAQCGWEQFAFENDGNGGNGFIQYWLLQYNKACPTGWVTYPIGTDTYCYRDSPFVAVPNQPITSLAQLSLRGTVSASADSVIVSAGSSLYMVSGDNSLNAVAGWQNAEFNVFGDGGGGQAVFNSGAQIVPRIDITYGGTAAPVCVATGYTGETNNLSFGSSAPAAPSQGPAIIFNEGTTGSSTASCTDAATVGENNSAPPPGTCPQQNLTLQGTISSGPILEQAYGTITANSFLVNGSANVMLQAGNTIYLKPGFQAMAGSAGTTFQASINPAIQPCAGNR